MIKNTAKQLKADKKRLGKATNDLIKDNNTIFDPLYDHLTKELKKGFSKKGFKIPAKLGRKRRLFTISLGCSWF